jgi:hypothetical protein
VAQHPEAADAGPEWRPGPPKRRSTKNQIVSPHVPHGATNPIPIPGARQRSPGLSRTGKTPHPRFHTSCGPRGGPPRALTELLSCELTSGSGRWDDVVAHPGHQRHDMCMYSYMEGGAESSATTINSGREALRTQAAGTKSARPP